MYHHILLVSILCGLLCSSHGFSTPFKGRLFPNHVYITQFPQQSETALSVATGDIQTTSKFIPPVGGDVPLSYSSVFLFGKGHVNQYGNMKHILGGKGANLAGMSNLGT